NEVGGALWNEVQLRLGAVEPTLAGQATRAYGDTGLDGVITGAERILVRVEQNFNAAALIIVQKCPEDRCQRASASTHSQNQFPAESCQIDDENPGTENEQSRAQIRLFQDKGS